MAVFKLKKSRKCVTERLMREQENVPDRGAASILSPQASLTYKKIIARNQRKHGRQRLADRRSESSFRGAATNYSKGHTSYGEIHHAKTKKRKKIKITIKKTKQPVILMGVCQITQPN